MLGMGQISQKIAKIGKKTLRLLKSVLYKPGRGWFRMSLRILPSQSVPEVPSSHCRRALSPSSPPRNAEGYRDWAHPPHREIVRSLARDATAGPVFYRRQLPPHMLLIDHLLRTSLFPLQHYVQRRGPILQALYRISGNFWFSPSELVMTSLLQFEEKVHRKDMTRAESIPLLMPRLLCYVLEQMGFPEEPRLEMRARCLHVVSVDRVMTMPISFHIRPQD